MKSTLRLPEKDLINSWYNEPTIFRLMDEKKWPRDIATQWFTDFMRWLYTCNRWNLENETGFIMDNMHPLDDIWHAYILNTKAYFKMSKELFNVDRPFKLETRQI